MHTPFPVGVLPCATPAKHDLSSTGRDRSDREGSCATSPDFGTGRRHKFVAGRNDRRAGDVDRISKSGAGIFVESDHDVVTNSSAEAILTRPFDVGHRVSRLRVAVPVSLITSYCSCWGSTEPSPRPPCDVRTKSVSTAADSVSAVSNTRGISSVPVSLAVPSWCNPRVKLTQVPRSTTATLRSSLGLYVSIPIACEP